MWRIPGTGGLTSFFVPILELVLNVDGLEVGSSRSVGNLLCHQFIFNINRKPKVYYCGHCILQVGFIPLALCCNHQAWWSSQPPIHQFMLSRTHGSSLLRVNVVTDLLMLCSEPDTQTQHFCFNLVPQNPCFCLEQRDNVGNYYSLRTESCWTCSQMVSRRCLK